MEKVIRLDT